ncbi:integrase, catalytic region, zinc finger, CCHC-type containing protein [Tanacetum coccineum]
MVNHLNRITQEWQRFVTLVKQSHELKTISYHKLYDILKQHQTKVNQIRTNNSSAKLQPAATRHRGKAIVNSSSPTSDQEPEMVAEDDALSKEKEIDKLMALISLSFKKIYKPINNNLRTSPNTKQADWKDENNDELEDQELEMVYSQVLVEHIYSITLEDTSTPTPICLMAKATLSQAWLWHRHLSHLNFDSINLLLKNDIVIGLLKLVHRGLHAQVRTVRTDRGTEFLNKTLHAYFAQEGIEHQTSFTQTPKQNGVVERRNPTLVEAARTMLSAAKVPLYFWAEAIATTCFTQNRSLIIPRHEKTPYHIINGRKPSFMFFHIFGSLCYIVRDGENLDKMKEKRRCMYFCRMASDHITKTITTSNELDLLFSLMFDELLNGTTLVVSKSSAVTVTDAPNKHHQQHTTPSTSITVDAETPPVNI